MKRIVVSAHLQLRLMSQADIAFAMKVKAMARWNQLEADWELLLTAGREGNFVAIYEGKEAGTLTTLPYQDRFNWIGMVLVNPSYRGLGIGRTLVETAIRTADRKATIRLDATPQGMKLYQTLGFQVETELWRLERKTDRPLPAPLGNCSVVDRGAIEQIIKMDPTVFGADRAIVLRHLQARSPHYGYYLEYNGVMSGYCFGRSGSNFEHIGPIIARNVADARDLLLSAMAAAQSKPVIVDVYAWQQSWLDELQNLGFVRQRPFIRMHLGALPEAGNINLQYAIAGPELG
ncbi:GNAT family N-acetyltransferase [Rhodocytophaga rosea]|uniref:GNAT family N-acetyltransferase n=1 Tax=Rhodocytophaga rosea TaxID=2704465 RepID=A0A6C0GHU0_9BACT|nr:GNAT family N-acetyltransferase [Rhodocytophaga rosea]QHT67273.1 GNAT family N-acetyltransferase [Rhodocytophaga rosea]